MIAGHIQAALERWSGLPMVWGESDCAMAVADIYVAAGLPDPMAPYRGRYKTRVGAIRKIGRGGFAAAIDGLGWPPLAPAEATDGDLGLMLTPDGTACVIFYRGFWVGRLDGGYAAHPVRVASHAWRPPCLKH